MTIYNLTKSALVRSVTLLAACIALSACNDNTDLVDIVEDGEAGVVSLKTSSDEIQLAVGQTRTLSTTAVYDSGVQSTFSDSLKWISQNDSIATVSADGTVTAVSPGVVAISYHWRRISGTTQVVVSAAELASIEFSSTELEGRECSQSTVTATGLYTDGSTQPLPVTSQWTSTSEAVARIQSQDASSASIVLVDSGNATLALSTGAITASLPVVVTDTLTEITIDSESLTLETGTEQVIRVSGLYADGTDQIIDSAMSFSLSNALGDASTDGLLLDTHPEPTPASTDSEAPETESSGPESSGPEPSGAQPETVEVIVATSATLDIVQLEDASLLIRAKQAGETTVSATCGGQTGTLNFTVTEPPVLETLSFTSTDIDLEPGDAVTPELTAHYSDTSARPVTDAVQWAILSGDVNSFQLDAATGQVTANPDTVLEQSIILQASYQSVTTHIEIISNRGVIEEVVDTQLFYVNADGDTVPLTTSTNSLTVGDTLQLSLKTVYNTGEELFSATDLFWSNLNPQIASIDGAGLLTAHMAGISSIFAIKDNTTATFQFTVAEDTTSAAAVTP